jgi:pimeloyl-ACP methyl ester carboxylesterase
LRDDVGTIAAETHDFLEARGLAADRPSDVIGHDIETWLANAYAANWCKNVKRLAVFDAALPGITLRPCLEYQAMR